MPQSQSNNCEYANDAFPEFIEGFVRMCVDACARGWHEANGGNLSYRLSDDEVALMGLHDDAAIDPWHVLMRSQPDLAGSYVLITASGAHLRNIAYDLQANAGIIKIDDVGTAWRKMWGFADDAKPSSELETHLAIYANDEARIVYHAHCPHVIALSTLIAPDSRIWTRTLWQVMTEGIIVFPQGIAAAPWMIPGSSELAEKTSELMRINPACVWAQHGLIARAADFDAAFGIVETIEKAADIYLEARAANGGDAPAYTVSDEQLRAICDRYELKPNEDYLF